MGNNLLDTALDFFTIKKIAIFFGILLLLLVAVFAPSVLNFDRIRQSQKSAQVRIKALRDSQIFLLENQGSFVTWDKLSYRFPELRHRESYNGYLIEAQGDGNSFKIWAVPSDYNHAGKLSFYVDSDSGDIHGADHQGEKGSNHAPILEMLPVALKELLKQSKLKQISDR